MPAIIRSKGRPSNGAIQCPSLSMNWELADLGTSKTPVRLIIFLPTKSILSWSWRTKSSENRCRRNNQNSAPADVWAIARRTDRRRRWRHPSWGTSNTS